MNRTSAETRAPLIVKRPADERGRTELGWLHSRHTFSFGEYHDPNHMSFRSLRVLNDDVVEPGQGFGTHSHRDAEIFSYVIEGQLEHKDSLGHGALIRTGDLQYMSAGRGVQHSEFNPSANQRVHFLQIWLLPNTPGGEPRYVEKSLGQAARPNMLTLLFAGTPHAGAVGIRADAELYFGKLDRGQRVTMNHGPDRAAWIHVITGDLAVLGETLGPGDGAAITGTCKVDLTAQAAAEFLLFHLA